MLKIGTKKPGLMRSESALKYLTKKISKPSLQETLSVSCRIMSTFKLMNKKLKTLYSIVSGPLMEILLIKNSLKYICHDIV